MAADNQDQMVGIIGSMVTVCDKIVALDSALRQMDEELQSVNETWANLHTNWPGLFKDAKGNGYDGNPLPTPAITDRIILGTVWQTYTGEHLQKVKNHMDQLKNALDGVDPIGGGAVNRGRNIRKVATKTGI